MTRQLNIQRERETFLLEFSQLASEIERDIIGENIGAPITEHPYYGLEVYQAKMDKVRSYYMTLLINEEHFDKETFEKFDDLGSYLERILVMTRKYIEDNRDQNDWMYVNRH